jgi:hypothetical protein
MPVTAPNVQMAKINIPTGYETEQQSIAQKRRLAERMLSLGLAPESNMTSWAQVLGHLAQTWVGHKAERKADKMEVDLSGRVQEDYTNRRAAFFEDAKTMTPQQLTEKYGPDPMLQNEVKPYQEAYGAALKDRQKLTKFNGTIMPQGDAVGKYENDPNKPVLRNADGSFSMNAPYIYAQGMSNGSIDSSPLMQTLPNMQVTDRMPGSELPPLNPQGPAPMHAPMSADQAAPMLQSAKQAGAISGTDAARVAQSMGPNGKGAFLKWMQDNGIKIQVSSPQEARQLPSGTPILLPDGTPGVVP